MRYLRPKTVKSLYRGVLKRNPTKSEVSQLALDFARDPNMETRLSSMIYSEEFAVMVMPDLVRAATENYGGKRVFFLHVPKTAGTSVRLALVDALGIPSLNLYPRTSQTLPVYLERMNFWPYWAGHANIAAFPETHAGFTTFRETRSRILSQYRQQQFNAVPGENPHIISAARIAEPKAKNRSDSMPDFNAVMLKEFQSIVHWYIPNPTIQKNIAIATDMESYRLKVGSDRAWRRHVATMSEKEISKALEGSLKRISAGGWLHQIDGIVEAITKISGNPKAAIPKVNEFKKSELYKVETLSLATLERFEEIRKKDALVFKIATDMGILTDPLREDEDEIFHKALNKLGFKLP